MAVGTAETTGSGSVEAEGRKGAIGVRIQGGRFADTLARNADRVYFEGNSNVPDPDGGWDNDWKRVMGAMAILRDANFCNEAAYSPDPEGDPRTGGLDLHPGDPVDVPGAAAHLGDCLSMSRRAEACNPYDCTVRFRYVGNTGVSNSPVGGAVLRAAAAGIADGSNPAERPAGHGYALTVGRSRNIEIAIPWRQWQGWIPVHAFVGVQAVYGDDLEMRIDPFGKAHVKINGSDLTPPEGISVGPAPLQGENHGIAISRIHFGVPMLQNYEAEWPSSSITAGAGRGTAKIRRSYSLMRRTTGGTGDGFY